MTRQELLERLIRKASDRYGLRVTDMMFGDWLREKLIFTPPKTGRHRRWTCRQYRVALEICRLRSQGIDFAGILRWHLWIKGFNLPTFDPTKQRRALFKEFRRLRKEAVAPIHSTYDPRDATPLTPWKAQKLIGSIGTQDERLTQLLPILGDNLIGSWSLSRFDEKAPGVEIETREFVLRHLRALYPRAPEDELKELSSHLAVKMTSLLGGILGEPDEIESSGETSILTANRATFDAARNAIADLPGTMANYQISDPGNAEGYRAVAHSAITPQWRIINFVNFLHAVHRGGPELATQIRTQP